MALNRSAVLGCFTIIQSTFKCENKMFLKEESAGEYKLGDM